MIDTRVDAFKVLGATVSLTVSPDVDGEDAETAETEGGAEAFLFLVLALVITMMMMMTMTVVMIICVAGIDPHWFLETVKWRPCHA